MFSLKQKFKSKPLLWYALSIAATWAGVGSLMVGIELAQDYGIIPFLLWAFGNTIACMVFGIFAPLIPKIREIYRTRAMKIITGIVCLFQVWVMMNGIQSAIADTSLGSIAGTVTAYAFAIFFIFLLFKNGIIRNVLTDGIGWIGVYAVATVLCAVALLFGGETGTLPLGSEYTMLGLEKCIILIPGPFLYPYFFELLDYNDDNPDNTEKVNIRTAFIVGGVMFGAYLLFTYFLSLASLTPWMNIVKAILITLVGVSTLSSFLYSVYLTFGRKIGLALNIITVGGWYWAIPLGVMNAWTLMASVRIYIVTGSVIAAFIWHAVEKKKGRSLGKEVRNR